MISAHTESDKHAMHQQAHAEYRIPIDYLLSKIKHCVDNRQKYTDAMAHAEGRNVIKYLLTLNTIECQGYVAEIQLQAHRSFMHSFLAGILGLVLVLCGISIGIYEGGTGPFLDLAYITGMAGILTQFIAAIFLSMYNQSLRRMDAFHEHLRQVQREVMSIFIGGLVENAELRDTVVMDEIKHLYAMSSLDNVNQSAHGIPADPAPQTVPSADGPVT